MLSKTLSTLNILKGVCSPLVTAKADNFMPCLFPKGTSIFPFFTVITLLIVLHTRLSVTSAACSFAAFKRGSTILLLLLFNKRLIVLQGPLELNKASIDLFFEKEKE